MATSKAEIDSKFSDRIADAQDAADAMADALRNKAAGDWAIGHIRGLEDVDLTDPDSVSEAFSRRKLEEQFDRVTRNPRDAGTTGDLAAIQLQGDLLASLERAVRSRYMAGFCRCAAHAAARADAAGDRDGGVLRRSTTDHIEDLLRRA